MRTCKGPSMSQVQTRRGGGGGMRNSLRTGRSAPAPQLRRPRSCCSLRPACALGSSNEYPEVHRSIREVKHRCVSELQDSTVDEELDRPRHDVKTHSSSLVDSLNLM
jgi:hypothetical protein